MKKLLLLLVPLLLLVGCETSAEVGVEPPTKPAPKSNGIIVGVIVACELEWEVISMKHGVESCFMHKRNGFRQGFVQNTLWELTILTPQGDTYTVYTEFFKDLEGYFEENPIQHDEWLISWVEDPQRAPEPKLGDPWPPSE